MILIISTWYQNWFYETKLNHKHSFADSTKIEVIYINKVLTTTLWLRCISKQGEYKLQIWEENQSVKRDENTKNKVRKSEKKNTN